ncbi:MAG: sigma-54-dependent transcriptional regulator [bacterium]
MSETSRKRVLIAEDEQVLRHSLAELLTDEGYEVVHVPNGRAAFDALLEQPFDLILSDVRMPEMDGETLLAEIRHTAPQTPVILITAYGTVDSAVRAMRTGAYDYLLKPVNFDDLLLKIERAFEHQELSHRCEVATDQLAEGATFHDLIGQSPAMTRLFEMVRKLSQVNSTVLITGESGTGKELLARAIHYNGITRDKPFVAVNCGAIPEALIESELFGHRRGSFTGANRDKVGYFEAAHRGSLLLDEISTLPLNVQSTLLRVLEEEAVTPVGDTKPRPIDVRIIAASNRDLWQMVAEGGFREDLLYRLNIVELELPPLRRRREDIPLLAHHFLNKYTTQMNKRNKGITNAALRAMLAHPWRGNIRELENVIERAVIFADDRSIDVGDLPFGESGQDLHEDENLRRTLRQFERQHIIETLRQHNYDKAETASSLGIGVSSLYRKFDELDISKNLGEDENGSAQTK